MKVADAALDLVGVIEALYRFDLGNEAWLRLVASEVAPLVDRDRKGSVAMSVFCPDATQFSPTGVAEIGVSDAVSTLFRQGVPGLPPEYVADSFFNRSWCFSADLEGWDRIPGVSDGAAAALGVADLLGIGTSELDGRGCWFGSFQGQRRHLGRSERMMVTLVARHLKAAYHVRHRIENGQALPEAAGAVLEPGGRVVHARGAATSPAQIERLTRATRGIDQARCRRGRGDGLRALQSWQAQVGDGWTLVDSFERDGRRYVLAVQAQPTTPGFHLLSVREREVVRQALLGRDNKVIAYELGLAQSTVRVLIARAAVKVGARSRRELLQEATRAEQAAGRE